MRHDPYGCPAPASWPPSRLRQAVPRALCCSGVARRQEGAGGLDPQVGGRRGPGAAACAQGSPAQGASLLRGGAGGGQQRSATVRVPPAAWQALPASAPAGNCRSLAALLLPLRPGQSLASWLRARDECELRLSAPFPWRECVVIQPSGWVRVVLLGMTLKTCCF